MTKWKLSVVLSLLAGLLFPSVLPRACSHPDARAVFVHTLHPDYPFSPYAAGEIGILHPTYARSYLVVAFRYLDGGTFTPEQQRNLCHLWEDRLNRDWDSETRRCFELWVKERSRLPGIPVPEEIKRFTEKGDLWICEGVSGDAFRTAAATLQNRRRRYGEGSPAFRAWVLAQDQVFAGKGIPEALPATATPLDRADRDYQIAAARFYTGDWEESERLFGAIARDSASPWRNLAPYLVARAAVRVATFPGEERKAPDLVALARCEDLLRAILADPDFREIHSPAAGLLRFVLIQRDPDLALSQLDSLLHAGGPGDLYQDLWDYTVLLDRKVWSHEWDAPQERARDKEYSSAMHTRTVGELTDWVVTFQNGGAAAKQHALEMWRQRGSTPWFVAAIAKAGPADTDAGKLLEQAERVSPESRAFLTVQYHRVRLLLGLGRTAEARPLLTRLLAEPKPHLLASARNQFLSARIATATTFEELLEDMPRRPADICWDDGCTDLPRAMAGDDFDPRLDNEVMLSDDAFQLIGRRLPLRLLCEAAVTPLLPQSVRRRIAIAAWTRAVLLEREEEASALCTELGVLFPHLAKDFQRFKSPRPGESRRDTATFLLGRLPGLRPEVETGVGRLVPLWRMSIYRDNWWCQMTKVDPDSGDFYGVEVQGDAQPKPIRPGAPFLTAALRTEAAQEVNSIADLGWGPTQVARRTLAWAKAHPEDPRIPEALHHSCEALNYGMCRPEGEDTDELYKAVRVRLFNRYKQSPWNRTAPWR